MIFAFVLFVVEWLLHLTRFGCNEAEEHISTSAWSSLLQWGHTVGNSRQTVIGAQSLQTIAFALGKRNLDYYLRGHLTHEKRKNIRWKEKQEILCECERTQRYVSLYVYVYV